MEGKEADEQHQRSKKRQNSFKIGWTFFSVNLAHFRDTVFNGVLNAFHPQTTQWKMDSIKFRNPNHLEKCNTTEFHYTFSNRHSTPKGAWFVPSETSIFQISLPHSNLNSWSMVRRTKVWQLPENRAQFKDLYMWSVEGRRSLASRPIRQWRGRGSWGGGCWGGSWEESYRWGGRRGRHRRGGDYSKKEESLIHFWQKTILTYLQRDPQTIMENVT